MGISSRRRAVASRTLRRALLREVDDADLPAAEYPAAVEPVHDQRRPDIPVARQRRLVRVAVELARRPLPQLGVSVRLLSSGTRDAVEPAQRARHCPELGPADRRGLTPLFWQHVRPFGEVRLDIGSRLTIGGTAS
jgi:hypothetical protein